MKRILALSAFVVAAAAVLANAGSAMQAEPRSGLLHLTKECSEYYGAAGEFCTITSSNIRVIKPGMRVVYLEPLGAGVLDTDIVLSSGRRKDAAFGHVVLDLATKTGRVTFSGGTGKFKGFQADAFVYAVLVDGSEVWHWHGTYSFT